MNVPITAAIASPEGGPFSIEQVELDSPRDDEILVEIKAVGLCHTDVVGQAGAFQLDLPVVLGHEGAGLVREIVPLGADYALDTSGIGDVLEGIMQSLSPQGTLGLVGIAAPGSKMPGEINNVMTFGHTVMGIIEGDSDPETFIPELMEHYLAGDLPVDKLLKTYPFHQINQAVADQHAGQCIKPILSFE